MASNNLQELMFIIDKNKRNISEYDYLLICQLMKNVYDETYDDYDDYDIDMEYSASNGELIQEYLKKFANIITITISVINVLTLAYYYKTVFF